MDVCAMAPGMDCAAAAADPVLCTPCRLPNDGHDMHEDRGGFRWRPPNASHPVHEAGACGGPGRCRICGITAEQALVDHVLRVIVPRLDGREGRDLDRLAVRVRDRLAQDGRWSADATPEVRRFTGEGPLAGGLEATTWRIWPLASFGMWRYRCGCFEGDAIDRDAACAEVAAIMDRRVDAAMEGA